MSVASGGATSAGRPKKGADTFSRRTSHVQMNAHFVESDTLVVTFAPRATPADAIWGLAPISKLGHSVLCFVDFADAWYPTSDILELKDAIGAWLQDYKRIVTYGHSMGGYGALKHGALFSAVRSVGLGPAWSVAPHDVQAFDERRPRLYYRPDLHEDMSIKAEDVAPDAIVVHDPFHEEDTLHYKAIARSVPQIKRVLNYFVGHDLLSPCIDCGAAGAFVREVTEGSGVIGLRTLIRQSRGASSRYVSRALIQTDKMARANATRMLAEVYGTPLAIHTPVRKELQRLGYPVPDLPERTWIEVFRDGAKEEALAVAKERPFEDFVTSTDDIRRWLTIHAEENQYRRISDFIRYVLTTVKGTNDDYLSYARAILRGGKRQKHYALADRFFKKIPSKKENSESYEMLKISMDLAIRNETTIPPRFFTSKYFKSDGYANCIVLPKLTGEFLRSIAVELPPGDFRLVYKLETRRGVMKHLNGDVLNKGGRSIQSALGKPLRKLRPRDFGRVLLGLFKDKEPSITIKIGRTKKPVETRVNIILKSNGRKDGQAIVFNGVHIVRV